MNINESLKLLTVFSCAAIAGCAQGPSASPVPPAQPLSPTVPSEVRGGQPYGAPVEPQLVASPPSASDIAPVLDNPACPTPGGVAPYGAGVPEAPGGMAPYGAGVPGYPGGMAPYGAGGPGYPGGVVPYGAGGLGYPGGGIYPYGYYAEIVPILFFDDFFSYGGSFHGHRRGHGGHRGSGSQGGGQGGHRGSESQGGGHDDQRGSESRGGDHDDQRGGT